MKRRSQPAVRSIIASVTVILLLVSLAAAPAYAAGYSDSSFVGHTYACSGAVTLPFTRPTTMFTITVSKGTTGQPIVSGSGYAGFAFESFTLQGDLQDVNADGSGSMSFENSDPLLSLVPATLYFTVTGGSPMKVESLSIQGTVGTYNESVTGDCELQ